MVMTKTQYKYQKIVEDILGRIERGELVAGDRLTSRALGKEFGCNYHTVRRAFAELVKQGYINQKPGSGTYITERSQRHRKRKVMVDKKMRETDKIGIILPQRPWGYYESGLIEQLHHSAQRLDLKLNIRMVTQIDIGTELLVRELSELGCCAVVLPWFGEGRPSDLHDFVRASELPVVLPNLVHGLEDHFYRNPEIHREDSANAIVAKGIYFRSLGYRKIALLGLKSKSFIYAIIQYINWVNHEKLPNLLEVVEDDCGDFDCIIDRWLPSRGELAVITCDDELALDFMDACKKRDIAVPEDFAIMGHGNHPDGARSDSPLSTTFFPYDCVADGMLSHAMALSRGSVDQMQEEWSLVFQIRESCRGPQSQRGQDNGKDSFRVNEGYKSQGRYRFRQNEKTIPVRFEKEQTCADGLAYTGVGG